MHKTAVVVVDVQERLFAAMEPERRDGMVANVKLVCHTARRLGLPILLTKQYPKGLGSTLPEVRALLPDVPAIARTSFVFQQFGSADHGAFRELSRLLR